MAQDWIDFVKQTQQKYGCSYKEALVIASKLLKKMKKKGGRPWGLSKEDQAQYIADKAANRNQKNMGSYTVWEKPN